MKSKFLGVFWSSVVKKSKLAKEKGIKTYDILKAKLVGELLQKESAQNMEIERNENFIRQMSVFCNQDLEMQLSDLNFGLGQNIMFLPYKPRLFFHTQNIIISASQIFI